MHNHQVFVNHVQEVIGFPAFTESKKERNIFEPIRVKEHIRETKPLVKNHVDGSIQQRPKLGAQVFKLEIQQVQGNISTNQTSILCKIARRERVVH